MQEVDDVVSQEATATDYDDISKGLFGSGRGNRCHCGGAGAGVVVIEVRLDS